MAGLDKLGHRVDLHTGRIGGDAIAPVGGGARVDVRGIAHRQPGGLPAFGGISFTVEPGERVAILASRGMGSSAVLEMMPGLRRPSAGEVAVDGLPVALWDPAKLRAQDPLLRSRDLWAGPIRVNLPPRRPHLAGVRRLRKGLNRFFPAGRTLGFARRGRHRAGRSARA